MMGREKKIAGIIVTAVLLLGALLLLRSYISAHPQQQYLVLDTTRDQFLGIDPGALGSSSALTFTAVSSIEDGEVMLLPLGVVGDWETLASPLLPYPIESATSVAYIEPQAPFRRRIYYIGGRDTSFNRLDSTFTCNINDDGSVSAWTLQTPRLPYGLTSAAAAISTLDYHGNPITPTIYVVGGKYLGGTSKYIYYTHIDPVSLDITGWHTATSDIVAPRLGLSAVVDRGLLYVMGGSDGGSIYSAAVYHIAIDETGDAFNRSVDVSFPGSANDNPNGAYQQAVLLPGVAPYVTDTIYVIGGYNGTNSTARVLRGDINVPGGPEPGYIHEWVDITSDDLPEPLSAFAVAVGDLQGAGRQVYIIGGTQGRDGTVPQNTIRSAAVDDSDNSFYNWYGGSWLTSPALPEVRYRHTAVQVGEYIYAIAGHGVNDPQPVLYDNILRGHLVGPGARHYAPEGEFRSRVIDLGHKYRLTWLQWTSTITPTDPGVAMTLQFRAGNEPDLRDAADGWSELYPTNRGQMTQTLVLIPQLPNFTYYPPVARYVQYRAFLSTTSSYSDVTPFLYEVGARVEDAPDLVVSSIQFSCNGCYGPLGIISETIQVVATVRNQGGSIPFGNNFFATMFITNSGYYSPTVPDWPTDTKFLPGSRTWGLQGSDFPSGASRTITATIFFTQPQSIFLYIYADYNDTALPPDYDVLEADPDNNLTVRNIILLDPDSAEQTETAMWVGTATAQALTPKSISNAYLSTVYHNYRTWQAYLPLVFRHILPTSTPEPTAPTPSPATATPSPSETPTPSPVTATPSPSETPTPSPVTATPSPSPSPTPPFGMLHIVFVSGYPCKQAGADVPIRAMAYVSDDGGLPVSDALVTVSISSDSWEMGPITGSPGYYGELSGTSCWNSATANPPRTYNSDWNVTVSAAKIGYGGSSATMNTSAQPPCSSCP
jgi:hypothetical protein